MFGTFCFRAAAVVVALVTASFIALPSFPHGYTSAPDARPSETVDRALKGDRLQPVEPVVAPPGPEGSRPAPGQARDRPPRGCEGAFSAMASAPLANVMRRCIV